MHLTTRFISGVLTHCSREFMQRAEASFRALHERLEYLERRQAAQGPSDEQLERVLRKILAERFADAETQRLVPNETKSRDFFAGRPNAAFSVPKTISLDVASLHVDPEAVPSKAYGQTLQMLEKGLQRFPQVDVTKSALRSGNSTNEIDDDFKHSKFSHPQADRKP